MCSQDFWADHEYAFHYDWKQSSDSTYRTWPRVTLHLACGIFKLCPHIDPQLFHFLFRIFDFAVSLHRLSSVCLFCLHLSFLFEINMAASTSKTTWWLSDPYPLTSKTHKITPSCSGRATLSWRMQQNRMCICKKKWVYSPCWAHAFMILQISIFTVDQYEAYCISLYSCRLDVTVAMVFNCQIHFYY